MKAKFSCPKAPFQMMCPNMVKYRKPKAESCGDCVFWRMDAAIEKAKHKLKV
jgi:hypothetical protein